MMHALWSCEEVQVAWKKYFGWVDRSVAAVLSFSDMLDMVKTKPHLLNIFAVTAWKLWNRRNKIRVGESVIPTRSFQAKKEHVQTPQHQMEAT